LDFFLIRIHQLREVFSLIIRRASVTRQQKPGTTLIRSSEDAKILRLRTGLSIRACRRWMFGRMSQLADAPAICRMSQSTDETKTAILQNKRSLHKGVRSHTWLNFLHNILYHVLYRYCSWNTYLDISIVLVQHFLCQYWYPHMYISIGTDTHWE
jgi:hypothetical protein